MMTLSLGALAQLALVLFTAALPGSSLGQEPGASRVPGRAGAAWTFLFYGAGDGSAEQSMLPDLADVRDLWQHDRGAQFALFIDRGPGHSDNARCLGEDFEDARLFGLARAEGADGAEGAGLPRNEYVRMAGGDEFPEITLDGSYEADTGDARTLAKFLRWGKRNFPAQRTCLIVYGHGDGHGMCPDETDGGELSPGEITAVCAREDSVDLLGLDVCSMGGIENAYQWRPGNGGLASASVSFPWHYLRLMQALFPESADSASDFAQLDALELGEKLRASGLERPTL